MRNVVLFMHVSLDGFVAGPKGELDWISYNEELETYAEGIVLTTGSPLYGRITYKMMEGYWPAVLTNPSATPHEKEHASWLENVEKIVFSKTMEKASWHNTKIINDNIPEAIAKLKKKPGKDLVVFGSPTLAQELMRLNLIDEFKLTINPVILGTGKPLFKDIKEKINLELIKSKTFTSGVVALHYKRK